MKVELSISDDRELRAAVHDMIRGEVVATMRGEIKNIIADLINEVSFPEGAKDLEGMVKAEIGVYVRGVLDANVGYGETWVHKAAREEIVKSVMSVLKQQKIG